MHILALLTFFNYFPPSSVIWGPPDRRRTAPDSAIEP
jgi:hypothetical protein